MIQRLYEDLEMVRVFTKEDVASWTRHTYAGNVTAKKGTIYMVSPPILAADHEYEGKTGTELNHLKLKVTCGGDPIEAIVGVYPAVTDGYDAVIDYHRPWNVGRIESDHQYGPKALGSSWRGMSVAWVMIEVAADTVIDEIEFRSWVGHGTKYGHEIDGFGEFWFAGGKFEYGISFPKDFGKKGNTKRYPLVLSTPGDGTQGCGDDKQFKYLVQWGSHLAGKWYHTEKFEAISVVYQMPLSGCVTETDSPYNGRVDYNEPGSWLPDAFAAFIRWLLAKDDCRIDTSRIYTGGFSRGGIQSWVMGLVAADLVATIVPCYESRSYRPRMIVDDEHLAWWYGLSDEGMARNIKVWDAITTRMGHLNVFRFYERVFLVRDWPGSFRGTYIEYENWLWRKKFLEEYGAQLPIWESCFTNGNHNSTQWLAWGTEEWMDRIFATHKNMSLLTSRQIPGDADMDGDVDLEDFGRLKEGFGKKGATWGQGDFTGDGIVDLQDFGLLKDHLGQEGKEL